MAQTPKGIMYIISIQGTTVFCYDDQTGKEETFSINDIHFLNNTK
jgi:hypothetical protein